MANALLTMNIKKVIPWGTGLALFVTKEAKFLGWNDKTYVIMTTIQDKEGEAIVIRRAPIPEKKKKR